MFDSIKGKIVPLFGAAVFALGGEVKGQTTTKDSTAVVSSVVAPKMDEDLERFFAGKGLEIVDYTPSDKSQKKFFLLPDDDLDMQRNNKDAIMVILQPVYNVDSLHIKGQLVMLEDMPMADTNEAAAQVIRARCTAAFFKNDGSGTLSAQNMLGYSMVDRDRFTIIPEENETIISSERIIVMSSGKIYAATFVTNGEWVDFDGKPKILKPDDKRLTQQGIISKDRGPIMPPRW